MGRNCKSNWKWQLLVISIYVFLSQPAYGISNNWWLSIMWGGVLFGVYVYCFEERAFPRNRKSDKIMIPIVVWIIVEFIADGIYAFSNDGPFFLTSFLEIFEKAFKTGLLEELLYTYVFVTLLIGIIKSRKKQLTKKYFIIIAFIASIVFGLLHLTNWSSLMNYYQGESQVMIACRIFVHVLSAFSFGLITKIIFLRTGSLLYCIVVHFVINISRLGTALTNENLIVLAIIVVVFFCYGVYAALNIDESVVDYWNRNRISKK